MKVLEIEHYDMLPLTDEQNEAINGGFWQALGVGLVISFVNNFDDFCDGVRRGWNGN